MSKGRSAAAESSSQPKDIYTEATQLVRIIANPAFALDTNKTVISMNASLATALNRGLTSLDNTALSQVPDDALATVTNELIDKASAGATGFVTSSVYFLSRELELNLQPVMGKGSIDYFIVTVTDPQSGENA